MNKPLPLIAISFILGIVCSLFVQPALNIAVLLAAMICLAAVTVLFKTRWDSRRVFVLLFMALGWCWAILSAVDAPGGVQDMTGSYVTVQGVVREEPQVGLDHVTYVVAVETVTKGDHSQPAAGLVQLRSPHGDTVYSYGDYVQAQSVLYLPRPPGNFGAFDYQAYLARRGIKATMWLTDPRQLQYLGVGKGGFLVSKALAAKHSLQAVTQRTMGQRQAAVLNGMMFGDNSQISPSIRDTFARIGVAHVLCVSGLHVGFVLAGAMLLVRGFNIGLRWAPAVVIPLLLFYMVMTGAGPAVVRATIMAAVAMGAVFWGRKRHWPSGLALAALVLLVYRPALLLEVGFQLSFGATWGILYLNPLLQKLMQQKWRLPPWLAAPLQITVAAQLGTLPILLYHFNLLSPVAPLANLLLVPLVGGMMLTGFVGGVLGLVWLPLGAGLHIITSLLIDVFLAAANFMAAWPGSSLYLATPPWYGVILWYAALVLLVEITGGNLKWPGAANYRPLTAAALSGLLLALVLWPWGSTKGQLEVHFIDVGQGDCILIRLPGGKNMLVDSGGKIGDLDAPQMVGENVVVPYLRHLGVRKIHVAVATHLHGDHVGGLPAVLEHFKVEALVTHTLPGLEQWLHSRGIRPPPVHQIHAGQTLHVHPRVAIAALAPPAVVPDPQDLNNASLVLQLVYGSVSFLFTGDIEEQAQRQLLLQYENLTATVLKVPHHGSRFMHQDWIKAVAPQYAVIQCGAGNPFGHPAPATLETLSAAGATILRNDLQGTVIISTDGRRIKVRTRH